MELHYSKFVPQKAFQPSAQGSLGNSFMKSLQRFQGTCNPTIKWENMDICIQRAEVISLKLKLLSTVGFFFFGTPVD